MGDKNRARLDLREVVKVRERNNVRFELSIPEFAPPPGAFVAVVGQSGCGKSTLLDMLALVLSPSKAVKFRYDLSGKEYDVWATYQVRGHALLSRIRSDHIGYVLQTGGLFGFLSVFENARLPARLKGVEDHDRLIRERAAELGIADFLRKKPQHLSGGQRQRSAILRALSNEPELILADEPTAAVDRANAEIIVRRFKELAKSGDATVIMVTHDVDLIQELADEVYSFKVERVDENLTQSTLYRERVASS